MTGEVFWAKIRQVSSQAKWHLWGRPDNNCPAIRSPKVEPTQFTRSLPPVKACRSCLRMLNQ